MNGIMNGIKSKLTHIRRFGPKGTFRLPLADMENRANLAQLQAFEAVLNRQGRSFWEFRSMLEFACGWGRLIEPLSDLLPQAQIYGCDIDDGFLEESRRRCPGAIIERNNITPPLEFEDGKFDLIWSYSVFTSLSEESHQVWLKELARKLAPNGVMLHTTHSYSYVKRAACFSPESLEKYRLEESLDDFINANREYYYLPYNDEAPDYGLAIISKEYITEQWPRITGLKLAEFAEGAIEAYPEGNQDIVMLVNESSNSPS